MRKEKLKRIRGREGGRRCIYMPKAVSRMAACEGGEVFSAGQNRGRVRYSVCVCALPIVKDSLGVSLNV